MATAAKIAIEIGASFAGSFKTVFGQASGEVNKIGSEIKKLETRQKELNAVIAQQQKLGANGSALKAMYSQQELDQITAKITKLRTEQQKLNAVHSGIEAGKSQMASASMALGTVAVAAATAAIPIMQAVSFEKAMLGVAKQVDGARDSSGKLTNVYYEMARQIQLLGREIPIATNDLAEMVAAGARMGVAKDELIGFTKTAAMMASAFDLPAAELADKMGKIAMLFKIPIPQIGKLADAINYLDDNAISKGADIIDFLTRTGGVAGSVKITGEQMAALGSTLLTLGERSETAGTATNAIFQKFAAGEKGTKKFQEAMDELGLSVEKVQAGMQSDAQGTILQVLDAVNKIDPSKRLGILTDLVGLEHSDTLAKLANGVGEYRKQIEMLESGKANGSMLKEFQAQLQTTNAQWEIAKNTITEVSVNLGTILLPSVNQVLAGFRDMTSGLADFVKENPVLVGNIITVVGTLATVFAATKAWAFGIGLVTTAFRVLSLAFMTNPIGLAITALIVAGMLLWKNWDAIKAGLMSVWEAIKDGAVAGFNIVKEAIGAVVKWMSDKIDWIVKKFTTAKDIFTNVMHGDFGKAFDNAKSFYGFDNAADPTAPAAPAPAVPATPRSVVMQNQPQYNINVQGSPADPNATAKAIRAEMERKERERAAADRASMMDAMGN